jgi:dTDP-4-amino-4,6-dideoxygalactose transaminase
MTALNIPDMMELVRQHGLTPVPLDISRHTLTPAPESLAKALSPRTRVVVVAHLFGAVVSVEPLLKVLEGTGVLLVEDCAPAFAGCHGYQGHPQSAAAMFSFGPIKTCTALGGALLRIREPELLRRMTAIESEFPVQQRRAFFLRLCKYAGLRWASSRPVWSVIVKFCQWRGIAYDETLNALGRGFAGSGGLMAKIRRRPSVPLLWLLRRRLRRFDVPAIERRRRNGGRLAELLAGKVPRPATEVPACSFWVFPLLSPQREALVRAVRASGFDAAIYDSLHAVPLATPPGRGDNHQAQQIREQLVYVPAGSALSDREIKRLADCLLRAYFSA